MTAVDCSKLWKIAILSTIYFLPWLYTTVDGQIYNQSTIGCADQSIPIVRLYCQEENSQITTIRIQKIIESYKTTCPTGSSSEGCDYELPSNSPFYIKVVDDCEFEQSCFVTLSKDVIPLCSGTIHRANYIDIRYHCLAANDVGGDGANDDDGDSDTDNSVEVGGDGAHDGSVEVGGKESSVDDGGNSVDSESEKVRNKLIGIVVPTILGVLLLVILIVGFTVSYRTHKLPLGLQTFISNKLRAIASRADNSAPRTVTSKNSSSNNNNNKKKRISTVVGHTCNIPTADGRGQRYSVDGNEEELYCEIDLVRDHLPQTAQYQDWAVSNGQVNTSGSSAATQLPQMLLVSNLNKSKDVDPVEEDFNTDEEDFDDWSDSEFDQSYKDQPSAIADVNKERRRVSTKHSVSGLRSGRKPSVGNQVYINCAAGTGSNTPVATSGDNTYYSAAETTEV